MDLQSQIKFIDDLIRECPDITIREYLDALAEIDNIVPIEPIMNQPKLYTKEDAQFMLTHRKAYSAPELAHLLDIPVAAVYNYGSRNKIVFKSSWLTDRERKKMGRPKTAASAPIVRPVAEYSNPGYIATQQKYL